jgi:hypothetical protein
MAEDDDGDGADDVLEEGALDEGVLDDGLLAVPDESADETNAS